MSNFTVEALKYALFEDDDPTEVTYWTTERYDWDAYNVARDAWTARRDEPGWTWLGGPTAQEFLRKDPLIEEHKAELAGYDDLKELLEASQDRGVVIPGFGIAHFVEAYGGEGQGEQYWFVFKLVTDPQERYFKADGYYASYDGGYYDDLYEVFPKQVTVTQWEQ